MKVSYTYKNGIGINIKTMEVNSINFLAGNVVQLITVENHSILIKTNQLVKVVDV